MCVYMYVYIYIYIYTRTIARASRALRFHLFRSPAYSAEEGTPPKKGEPWVSKPTRSLLKA